MNAAVRSKEAAELGDAIVRMTRSLITRAGEGETDALEQLQRVAQLAPVALRLGVRSAHDGPAAYSWATLGEVLGSSRQNAQQLAGSVPAQLGAGHVLVPGHDKRTCGTCRPAVVA